MFEEGTDDGTFVCRVVLIAYGGVPTDRLCLHIGTGSSAARLLGK